MQGGTNCSNGPLVIFSMVEESAVQGLTTKPERILQTLPQEQNIPGHPCEVEGLQSQKWDDAYLCNPQNVQYTQFSPDSQDYFGTPLSQNDSAIRREINHHRRPFHAVLNDSTHNPTQLYCSNLMYYQTCTQETQEPAWQFSVHNKAVEQLLQALPPKPIYASMQLGLKVTHQHKPNCDVRSHEPGVLKTKVPLTEAQKSAMIFWNPPLPVEEPNAEFAPLPATTVDARELFLKPDRSYRPPWLAIILRGISGSGKSWAAKKLRDIEARRK